ncbi:MAG: sulfite exporter TauE/SafE family protein, partial [Desulfurivibrionaceae bacterium]
GPFMVPLMTVALGLPMYIVVGSSLLAIFFNTAMGTVRHMQFGNFDLLLFLAMFPAALLGGYLGPQIAKRVSPTVVKRIACGGLLLLSLNLLGVY